MDDICESCAPNWADTVRNESEPWPAFLLERAMSAPPDNCSVVVNSTPIVAFGDHRGAAIATLGINPSSGEFLSRRGDLLSGDMRRLATLESLGVKSRVELDVAHASRILRDSANYFGPRRYKWFTPLEQIIREGASHSYLDGSACHLDLVQWATNPIWRELPPIVRAKLLKDGQGFLRLLLSSKKFRGVLVNGRTVIDQLQGGGFADFTLVAKHVGPPPVNLYVGEGLGQNWIAWSCNVQSQPGARRHIETLTKFIRTQLRV